MKKKLGNVKFFKQPTKVKPKNMTDEAMKLAKIGIAIGVAGVALGAGAHAISEGFA